MAASKKESNALIVAEDYSVTRTDNVLEALKENLGDDKLSVNDLDKVKVPSGGGIMWEKPDLDEADGIDHTKSITGVIVWFTNQRRYYKDEYSGGGQPPDCSSRDCKTGKGTPGGKCKICAFAQFGSAINKDGTPAKGQACKELRIIYIAVKNEKLPLVIVAPSASLRPVKTYLQRLGSKDIKYWTTESIFTLEKVNNSTGMEFSRIIVKPSRRLNDKAVKMFAGYRDNLIPYLKESADEILDEAMKEDSVEAEGEV